MMSIEDIEAAAMSLSPDERLELGEKLLGSLPFEFEAEWAEEVERRAEDLRTGRVQPVPMADVLREARERLR